MLLYMLLYYIYYITGPASLRQLCLVPGSSSTGRGDFQPGILSQSCDEIFISPTRNTAIHHLLTYLCYYDIFTINIFCYTNSPTKQDVGKFYI